MLSIPGASVTPEKLADWIEYWVLFSPEGRFSRSALRDLLEEDSGLDDLDSYDEFTTDLVDEDEGSAVRRRHDTIVEGISEADNLASDAFFALEERQRFVGHGYPCSISPELAMRAVDNWQSVPGYSFMTILNIRYMHGLAVDIDRGARIFERLIAFVMASYIVGNAEHFGWPRSGPIVERSFANALPLLLRRLGERLTANADDIPAQLKDNEVDVIAWRELGDGRPGKLVILCQCAIGRDWADKGINLGIWRPFVNFAVDPVRAAAFPFVPAAMREDWSGLQYEYLSGSVGLWFDRLRLAALIDEARIGGDLRHDLIDYTESVLALSPDN
jgi:hypothetical protein